MHGASKIKRILSTEQNRTEQLNRLIPDQIFLLHAKMEPPCSFNLLSDDELLFVLDHLLPHELAALEIASHRVWKLSSGDAHRKYWARVCDEVSHTLAGAMHSVSAQIGGRVVSDYFVHYDCSPYERP
jgi:hypothetical protein